MKNLVVFKSSTGFTKRYAEWIAEELKCESKSIKEVSKQELDNVDLVIYGGCIMGNMITGLDKIRKSYKGKLVIFAVGSTPSGDKIVEEIKKQNKIEEIPFYYMEGGFQFDKLGFFQKKMLNIVKKSAAKKENKTEQDIYMEKVLGTSFDNSDKKFIEPLIKCVENY